MHLKYKCKKDRSFGIFLFIACIIILGVAYIVPASTQSNYSLKDFLITSLFIIPLVAILIFCWFNTHYNIYKNFLIARSGPFVWKVNIFEIKKIRRNQKTLGGLWKPTLSWNCIEVLYKKYGTLSITPMDQEDFINDLININPEITIK